MFKKNRTYRELVLMQMLFGMLTMLSIIAGMSNPIFFLSTLLCFNKLFEVEERLRCTNTSHLKVAKATEGGGWKVYNESGVDLTYRDGLLICGYFAFPLRWMAVLFLWGKVWEYRYEPNS